MAFTLLAGYLALFVGVGIVFLAANLIIGWFLRPRLPNQEKLEVYECGEPTIGSSYVQFDLRFYVVALLFIIFDVEVAFFFPWATVFGKATHLMDPALPVVANGELTPAASEVFRQLGAYGVGVPDPAASDAANAAAVQAAARLLAATSIFDILLFFAVLMVGFAYVWSRGDLNWVRAVGPPRTQRVPRGQPAPDRELVLSG